VPWDEGGLLHRLLIGEVPGVLQQQVPRQTVKLLTGSAPTAAKPKAKNFPAYRRIAILAGRLFFVPLEIRLISAAYCKVGSA
jgi:hypothetical protein